MVRPAPGRKGGRALSRPRENGSRPEPRRRGPLKELRSLLPYYRPYRRGFALGMVCVVLANAFNVAGPWLIRIAVDALAEPGVTAGRIAGLAGLIVLAAVIGGVFRFAMRQLLNAISRRMEADLLNDFFRHLLRLDTTFHGSVRTGDLMSRATNDTLAVRMAMGPAIMYTVNTLATFTFALALMLWISPRLTAWSLVPLLVLPPIIIGFGRLIHRRFERIQEQFSSLSTFVQENLTGVRIVRAYGQERAQAEQFEGFNEDYRRRNMDLVISTGAFHPLLTFMAGLAMVLVTWVGAQEVVAGRITIGDFVAFGFYLTLLVWPMIALGWVVNLFQRGEASMGRLNRIFETEPAVRVPERPRRLERLRGEVRFEGVSFAYPGTKRPVLVDVDFEVPAGTTVALVGPTGSGKSTLIALLARLYDPTEGRVLVDGVPLTELDPADLRAHIGMVPQDAFLFSDSIAENIGLGLAENGFATDGLAENGRVAAERAAADLAEGRRADGGEGGPEPAAPEWIERVADAARVAQLDEQIRDFPRGYGTLLGERGINLSGGQKQRATLARALARDPRILVLDDALSAVDTHTEARILADLRDATVGRTTFIISHRVSAVMHADLILVLDEGRIVQRGRHAELIQEEGTYARLLRRQLLEEDLEAEPAGR